MATLLLENIRISDTPSHPVPSRVVGPGWESISTGLTDSSISVRTGITYVGSIIADVTTPPGVASTTAFTLDALFDVVTPDGWPDGLPHIQVAFENQSTGVILAQFSNDGAGVHLTSPTYDSINSIKTSALRASDPPASSVFQTLAGGGYLLRVKRFLTGGVVNTNYDLMTRQLQIEVGSSSPLRRYPRDDGRGFGGVKRNYPQSKASRNVGGQP